MNNMVALGNEVDKAVVDITRSNSYWSSRTFLNYESKQITIMRSQRYNMKDRFGFFLVCKLVSNLQTLKCIMYQITTITL